MAFKEHKTKKQPEPQADKVLQLKVGRKGKVKTFSAVGGKPLSASKWNAHIKEDGGKDMFCVDCGALCEIEGDTYFICTRNPSHPRYFVSLIEEKGITNPKMVRVE